MDYPEPVPFLTLPAEQSAAAAVGLGYGDAAFLDGAAEDAAYFVEESSASNTSYTVTGDPAPSSSRALQQAHPAASSSSSSSRALVPSQASVSPPTKQRMERRGHTKSRRGCFNCKRRRIKCQENKPACNHCVKSGLQCEYPKAPLVIHQPQHQIPIFSLQDMRFFQHFLLKCYPRHPLGNESVWTHEIPCLSEKHGFLMHAILGLAASELMQQDPSLLAAAVGHRLKAIRAIKKTLAGAEADAATTTFEEGNAMLATCFALTFQSVLLDDGMAEYMTFIRGVVIVAVQMYTRGCTKFVFSDFWGEEPNEGMRPRLERTPLVRREWREGAAAAVRSLEGICRGDGVERRYWELVVEMTDSLGVSSLEAYRAMTRHYSWWMQLPHEQFRQVVDASNPALVLLSAHWIAIKQVMAPITEAEYEWREKEPAAAGGHGHGGGDVDGEQAGGKEEKKKKKKDGDMNLGMVRWLRHLNAEAAVVDGGRWAAYNAWPVWVEEMLGEDLGYFGKTH